jgi:glc operon protein GlcG
MPAATPERPLTKLAEALFAEIERLLPRYRAVADDARVNEGNVAVILIGTDGDVCGRFFGDDRVRLRDTAGTAWRKAGQVWLTGVATGEYERRVYNGEVEWWKLGVMKPDLIGWEGGIPVRTPDGPVSIGFSGFRGETDVALLKEALAAIGLDA